MEKFSVSCALFVLFVLTAIEKGDALRCWSCSSEEGGTCSDYFNSTRYTRISSIYNVANNYPFMTDCDTNQRSTFPFNQNQRTVCMKKKQTNYGRTSYMRECHFLQPGEQVGKCPEQTTPRDVTIDFCEYCDWDGCNGAHALQTYSLLYAGVVSIIYMIVS